MLESSSKPQRQTTSFPRLCWSKAFTSRTMAVQVRYKFWYICKTATWNYQVTPAPNHCSNQSSRGRSDIWVKFKMADCPFKENPPSREINKLLQQSKGRYTSQTSNTTHLRDISRFYSEVEAAVAAIEQKYTTRRSREVHQLLQSQGMVIRTLQKLHNKISRRLRSRPNLANPWRGDFTIDVPREVFNVISCHYSTQ